MMENRPFLDLAAGLLLVVEQILTGYCLARLVKPFLARPGKYRRVWAAYSAAMLLLAAMQLHPASSTTMGIGILTAFLVLCLTDKRNYEQKIFLCAAFFSLCWLAYAITEILLDSLYSFATHTAYMAARPQLWQALYLAMRFFYLFHEMTLVSVFVGCLLKVYTYKSANMSKKELCLLLIPLFTGTGGFEIIHYYRSFFILETGQSTGPYDIRALLYYRVSMAAVAVVVGLYQSIKARQEERLQNELLAAQIDSIRHHISQVETLYQSIRAIRHDMANHLLTLESLYAKDRMEEAREYSAELKSALAGTAGGIASGNPVTDVILQDWKNAVEHAAQPSGEEPLISVRAYHRNNAYLIEVANSFAGSLRWDAESGLPATSKEEKDGHGYGLPNIRRVANKYAGGMAIDLKDGIFSLCVMLIMQK